MNREEQVRQQLQEAMMANDQVRIQALGEELSRLQKEAITPAQKRINESFSVPTPVQQEEIETTMPRLAQVRNEETGEEVKYTPRSLLESDTAMNTIRSYMHSFEGIGPEISDEEVVDMYLMRMRSFAGGNSVTTLNEIFQIQKADNNKKAVAGQAYDLFDQMSGVFSDDYTWGEMFGGLGSYARAAIIDPVNLFGVGIGKAVTHAGTKTASAAVQTLATQAAKEATKKAIAGGATKMAAQEAGRVAAKRVVQKQAQSAAVKSGIKSAALKEIGVVTGVDAATALGIDYAYQWGMMETGQQEEWSPFQSGLTALGAIGAGIIDVGIMGLDKGLAKKGTGSVENILTENRVDILSKNVAEGVDMEKLSASLAPDNFKPWEIKVEDGLDLEKMSYGSVENYKWQSFMLGRQYEDGTVQEGLVHKLKDSGFRTILPRYQGDNLTSQMGDFVLQLSEKDQKNLMAAFRKTMGEKHYRGWKIDDFVDYMSAEWHLAGQKLNLQSQASKTLGQLGVDPESVPAQKALQTLQVGVEGLNKVVPKKLAYFQNTLIQTIVAHPATTALNVIGSTQRTALEMLSDVVRAGIYTTRGMKGLATGNFDELNRGIRIAKSIPQGGSMLLRPSATKKEFQSLMELRPEADAALFRWLSGGVDASQSTLDQFDIDPNTAWGKIARGTEKYKNFAQRATLVHYQDRTFKSVNFMRHLDRNLMEEYGMSYSDFMNRPAKEILEDMNSERYAKVELLSVDQTNMSVFSKSYSSKETLSSNPFHAAATWIEEFRKVPLIGAMAPFGQFFNNTIDMMADYSGAKLLYRATKPLVGGDVATDDDMIDAVAKGAVGWAAALMMSNKEEENIRDGLAWNEDRDVTGAVRDYTYDFPGSAFKMAARMLAHLKVNGEIPESLQEEAARTFGPEAFTRGFNQPIEDITEDISAAISQPGMMNKIWETNEALFEHIGAAWASGYTRPIDPINQFVGGTKEGGQVYLDRKSGEEWINKSFRYLDQFMIGALKKLGAQEKTPTFEGENIQTIGKTVGYRTISELSPAQKMFNSIERPYFMDEIFTEMPEVDNAMRGSLQDIIDENAIKLMNSKNWNNLNLQSRKSAVEGVIRSSVKQAQTRLRMGLSVEDRRLATLFEMKNEFGEERLQRAFSSLGFDENYTDLSELDAAQLMELRAEVRAIPKRDERAPFGYEKGTLRESP